MRRISYRDRVILEEISKRKRIFDDSFTNLGSLELKGVMEGSQYMHISWMRIVDDKENTIRSLKSDRHCGFDVIAFTNLRKWVKLDELRLMNGMFILTAKYSIKEHGFFVRTMEEYSRSIRQVDGFVHVRGDDMQYGKDPDDARKRYKIIMEHDALISEMMSYG